jgi:hypothetical protein
VSWKKLLKKSADESWRIKTKPGKFVAKLSWSRLLKDKRIMEKIYTDRSRTKLTEYGNKFVLEYFRNMDPVERSCKFARFDMEDMMQQISRGFINEDEKKMFKVLREAWYERLRNNMAKFRISKETLKTFGLDWKEVRSFYFQTI